MVRKNTTLKTPAVRAANVNQKAVQKNTQNLLKILRELQKIDPEFPLQYAVCLAEISLDEGLSITALSERTHMAISTVSRIVGALSKHRQKGQAYDLIKVSISATERRRKELTLTARGKAFMRSLSDLSAP